jgi:hypothetical protein
MVLEQTKKIKLMKTIEDLRKCGEISIDAAPILMFIQQVKMLIKYHK